MIPVRSFLHFSSAYLIIWQNIYKVKRYLKKKKGKHQTLGKIEHCVILRFFLNKRYYARSDWSKTYGLLYR